MTPELVDLDVGLILRGGREPFEQIVDGSIVDFRDIKWSLAMEISSNRKERLCISARKRTRCELAKRILKLRWMGMDDEAEQMRLALQRVEPGVTLLGDPCCTD